MTALAAFAYAAVAEGAYYFGQLAVAALLVAIACTTAMVERRFSRREVDAPVIAAAALGAACLLSGVVAHRIRGALPAIVLLTMLAAVFVIVRRGSARERELALIGLIGVGVVVAMSGWIGVAWRQSPRALEDGGLWRAASTITYANATGALLAALALLTLGTFVAQRRGLCFVLAAYVLLLGLFATASRAGVLGFAAGFAVLVIAERGRVFVSSLPIVAGAVVAFAALLPSMPASGSPHPILAVAGLILGGVIANAPARVVGTGVVVVAGAALAIPGPRSHVAAGLRPLQENRLTTSSPDRSRELHAAFAVAEAHPVTGVGPGQVDLQWNVTTPAQDTMHVAYAHDEYLQLYLETGAIGAVIALTGFAAIAIGLIRARRDPAIVGAAGCVAALVALAVHSSMDFLWHIPIIGLTGAVLVGALSSSPFDATPLKRKQRHESKRHQRIVPGTSYR